MARTAEEEEAEKRAQWMAERVERNKQLKIDSRFGLPFAIRLPLAASLSCVAGMALGLSHGSQTAGLRFRAENAHRLPTTPTGWYLYHKSKNYNMALGGVKEGLKMGAKVGFWTAGFFGIEEMFDRYRGTKDFLNTVVASLSVAGGFSLWSMSFPGPSTETETDPHRPLPRHHRSADGKERIGHRPGIWARTRCNWRHEGKAARLCRPDISRRKTKIRHRQERSGMINDDGPQPICWYILATACHPTRVLQCRIGSLPHCAGRYHQQQRRGFCRLIGDKLDR